MNKPQIIRDDAGQPAFAVLPWREFERLAGTRQAEEALTDEELYDLAKASDEESFPVEVVQALVDGEHPIAVFCRHRGMRQRQVAEKVGIHPTYLPARGSPSRSPAEGSSLADRTRTAAGLDQDVGGYRACSERRAGRPDLSVSDRSA